MGGLLHVFILVGLVGPLADHLIIEKGWENMSNLFVVNVCALVEDGSSFSLPFYLF